MQANTIQLKAGGNISPSRFVMGGGSQHTVIQNDGGSDSVHVGVSQDGAKDTPIPGASTLAAESGDSLQVTTFGGTCLLEVGTAGVTAMRYVKSDANGAGETVTDNSRALAIALEGGTDGEFVKVLVMSAFQVDDAVT